MSYKDELREQALKRQKRDYINKMILLIIALIVVLGIIYYLGDSSQEIAKSRNNTNNPKVERVEDINENK